MGRVIDTSKRIVYDGKALISQGANSYILTRNPQLMDHFVGDALHADFWATNTSAGGTAFAISAASGGMIRGACGATDDEKAEIAGEIIWKPSDGPIVFEARAKVSAITTVALNLGLSDAKNEGASTIAITQATATLTTNASNGVFWFFDTDSTNDNWHAAGVKADVDTAASNSGIAPVADTYQTFRIELDTSGNAVCMILDDASPAAKPLYQTYLPNATTATTLLTPYFGIQARTTSSRNMDLDYVFVSQERA